MKAIVQFGFMLIALLLYAPAVVQAQADREGNTALRFFMEKAVEDAGYEQTLALPYAEDEIDFWKDQRNFEKTLKKQSYTAYQVYISSKWKAYAKHNTAHTTQCTHSEHYYLQAAFYAQNGNKDITSALSTASATADAGISATAKIDD